MPKKSKGRSSKKDRSSRKKQSASRSRLSKKKKQTKLTLADYDDVQQSLLKREESAQRAKERLLQKEKKKKQKKVATKIQSATRGRQSRKQTDWKKRTEPMPFPFEKRILTSQILGNDIETVIDRMEKLDDTRIQNIDLLKNIDQSMYDHGKKYTEGKGFYGSTKEIQDMIQFRNKNREALYDIYKQMNKKSGKPLPNKDDLEYKIVTDVIPDYIYHEPGSKEYLLGKKNHDKWLTKLYDFNMVDEGKRPVLEPITEEDDQTYRGDQFIHSNKRVQELKDYYQKIENIKDFNENYDNEMNILEHIKYKLENLDILDCHNIRRNTRLLLTDIKLYKDNEFLRKYIEPCKDNKLLTEVYINTFYSVPIELIQPDTHRYSGIKEHIDAIPADYLPFQNDKNKLLKILEHIGVYKKNAHTRPVHANEPINVPPTDNLYLLARFLRNANKENIQRQWAKDSPFGPYRNIEYLKGHDGEDVLRDILWELELYLKEKNYEETQKLFDFNIEKTKRYIILILMGLVQNPNYHDTQKTKLMDLHEDIGYLYNALIWGKDDEEGERYRTISRERLDDYSKKILPKKVLKQYEYDMKVLQEKEKLYEDYLKLHDYFELKLSNNLIRRRRAIAGYDKKYWARSGPAGIMTNERLEELEEDLPGGLLGPAPYDREELKEKGTDSERVTNWDIAYGTDTLHPGRKGVRFAKTEARSARDFK